MPFPIIKNFLDKSADYFGLRVVDPKAISQYVDIVTEADRVCGVIDGIDPQALRFNLRFYTNDSPYIAIVNYKPIIYHTVERVTRTAVMTTNVLASTTIGIAGYLGIINPMAPLFVLISVIITIVSFGLFLTSCYFDNKLQKDMAEHKYTTLKVLDRASWEYIKKHLNAETAGRLERKFEEKIDAGQVYVPSGELSVFLTEEGALDAFVEAASKSHAEVRNLMLNRQTHPITRNAVDSTDSIIFPVDPEEWVEMVEVQNFGSVKSPVSEKKSEWLLV